MLVDRIRGFGLTIPACFFAGTKDVRVDLLREFQVIARRLNALATLLADLTPSPLACPMSWIPLNPVPVLCKAQETKAPPALALAQGLQVRCCFRTQS